MSGYRRKIERVNTGPKPVEHVDPEIYRLSELQMEHLGLVGLTVSAAGRASLAAAARVRLAADEE